MHPVIAKTFGGLSPGYYSRQFCYGLIFPVLMYFTLYRGMHSMQVGMILFFAINTLLYPYARFIYESVMEFLMGDSTIYANMLLMRVAKIMAMIVCWSVAIFMAPVGLAYLYYYHSKAW